MAKHLVILKMRLWKERSGKQTHLLISTVGKAFRDRGNIDVMTNGNGSHVGLFG